MLIGRHPNLPPPSTTHHLQGALRWAEQAGENPAYLGDALALQAGLHLEKRDYHNAKQASRAALRLAVAVPAHHHAALSSCCPA